MENTVELKAQKRPAGVWVICIYYFLTGGFTLLSMALAYRGAANLTPQEKIYLASMTTFDYVLTIISAGLTLSAAMALFMLRRAAFPLFCAALAMSMAFTIWHMLVRHWISVVGSAGLMGAAFGWMVMLVVCIYTARLRAQGILR